MWLHLDLEGIKNAPEGYTPVYYEVVGVRSLG